MGVGTQLPIEPVLAMILAYHTDQGPGQVVLNGAHLRFDKSVLRTFALSGSCCAECKLQASHFELMQSTPQAGQPNQMFLQLIAIQRKNRIVFTQDHILARSLGGTDDSNNLTTMCKNCNLAKSKKEHALLVRLRSEARLTQDGWDPLTQTTPLLRDALAAVGKLSLWEQERKTYAKDKPHPEEHPKAMLERGNEDGPKTLPDYLHELSRFCTYAEAGFYFEEGGCWGMALAIQAQLTAQGYRAEVVVQSPFIHTLVRVGDLLVDHQGVTHPVEGIQYEPHTPDSLRALACDQYGANLDQVEADQAWADDILKAAQASAMTPSSNAKIFVRASRFRA